jgi:hypothetical protein
LESSGQTIAETDNHDCHSSLRVRPILSCIASF